jgi:HSP20 family molecular chaperone IbpA
VALDSGHGAETQTVHPRSDFRESTDGRAIVATFELPDVAKEDVHVSFQRNKLVVTWEMGELHEWEEDGVVFRELIRSVHHRTLPLPEGTRVRCGVLSH